MNVVGRGIIKCDKEEGYNDDCDNYKVFGGVEKREESV